MIHTLAPPDGNRYLRDFRHFQERAEALRPAGQHPSERMIFSEGETTVRVVPFRQRVQTREMEGPPDDSLQHYTEYQMSEQGLLVTERIDEGHDLWFRTREMHHCLVNPDTGTLTMIES